MPDYRQLVSCNTIKLSLENLRRVTITTDLNAYAVRIHNHLTLSLTLAITQSPNPSTKQCDISNELAV